VPDERRALLVEDDGDTREALAEILRAWGFEVDAAGDADGALELVRRRDPDVIITDLSPLEGEPCDLIRRLRLAGADALIVVYSGRNEMRERAPEAGADAFILKPDLDGLERLLRGREGGVEAQRRERPTG
jgi:DNA-binding response OmpR family regulator